MGPLAREFRVLARSCLSLPFNQRRSYKMSKPPSLSQSALKAMLNLPCFANAKMIALPAYISVSQSQQGRSSTLAASTAV